jgi:hypothetical protein
MKRERATAFGLGSLELVLAQEVLGEVEPVRALGEIVFVSLEAPDHSANHEQSKNLTGHDSTVRASLAVGQLTS